MNSRKAIMLFSVLGDSGPRAYRLQQFVNPAATSCDQCGFQSATTHFPRARRKHAGHGSR